MDTVSPPGWLNPLAQLQLTMLRAARLPAEVSDLTDSTSMDGAGAVTSIQSATVRLQPGVLGTIWNEHWLERLARTYWRWLGRVTLHLIRVIYRPDGRDVVLLARPLRLLTFGTPSYELSDASGSVTWPIEAGLLVARKGEGQLRITVERIPDDSIRVDVEVLNFYPAIASRISDHLYRWTQSKIHVLVTWGFLRSLARGDLAESKAGRFADDD